MASDRIGKRSANLVALPPHEWIKMSASELLSNEVVAENIENIPVNEPLMESLIAEGMHNPILCLSTYWPIAGGQRVRAIYEIRKTDKDFDMELNIWLLVEIKSIIYSIDSGRCGD